MGSTVLSAVEIIPVLLSTMIEAFSSCKMQKLSNFNSFCISVHKLNFFHEFMLTLSMLISIAIFMLLVRNAYMLSSEYATYLSGRCVEIKMLPLSFSEFLTFHDFEIRETKSALGGTRKQAFDKTGEHYELREVFDAYMRFGGMPGIADVGLDLKRFDIKGKEFLRTLGKYYIVDIGLRNYLLGFRDRDSGHAIENVVCFELLRRGYDVSIGKVDNSEVDFIATKVDDKLYVQVTETMTSKDVRKRELPPLQKISDNYEKIILSLNTGMDSSYDGIKSINLIDWLISE